MLDARKLHKISNAGFWGSIGFEISCEKKLVRWVYIELNEDLRKFW
jgi:hypothetical protein